MPVLDIEVLRAQESQMFGPSALFFWGACEDKAYISQAARRLAEEAGFRVCLGLELWGLKFRRSFFSKFAPKFLCTTPPVAKVSPRGDG